MNGRGKGEGAAADLYEREGHEYHSSQDLVIERMMIEERWTDDLMETTAL